MDDKWLLAIFIGIFLFFYFVPQNEIFKDALIGGLLMSQEYARKHVLTCLVPAFFIAGAITALLKKEAVLKYLGSKANKIVSYAVASISGIILAVCSCTVLPLFAGIWKRGAGLGPAIAFLYSGPAINITAILLTASVLGFQLGAARTIAAALLSIVIGLTMEFMFRKENRDYERKEIFQATGKEMRMHLAVVFIFVQILFLIVNGLQIDFSLKLFLFALIISAIAYITFYKLTQEQVKEWLLETWVLSKSLLPVLFIGVFIAGAIGAILPDEFVWTYVGGNGLAENFVASIAGAFMYFATLTEIPIIQALVAKGMGAGPSLALLLSGPSLSLPSILAIDKILGHKKTIAYIALVVFFSTLAGMVYGIFAG
ncbi:MAG: permease [Candidatus Anstonellaceae archaeon]